jgi:hypothetical protein
MLTLCIRANKKHAKVYNQDCNTLLEHAIQFYNGEDMFFNGRDLFYRGKDLPALRSLDDGKLLPPLPKPGEVDLICGGKCS